MKKKTVEIKDIIAFLGDSVVAVQGPVEGRTVDNLADPEHTEKSTLDWVKKSNKDKRQIVENSPADTLIVDPEIEYNDVLKSLGKTLIAVARPRMAISLVAAEFFLEKDPAFIHPGAIIDEEAVIDPTAYIGPGCIVGKAKIGAHTSLKAGVIIYDDVEIGDNCLIQAGAVIGTVGSGYQRNTDGRLFNFPHLGGVVLGNYVDIGANTQISRGVFGNTVIKDGCKLSGLCFVAHNCVLEENVWITGNTMLCGSVRIGRNATIYSNVTVRDRAQIGERAVVGMGSLVTKNIPAGETWFGSPARKKE